MGTSLPKNESAIAVNTDKFFSPMRRRRTTYQPRKFDPIKTMNEFSPKADLTFSPRNKPELPPIELNLQAKQIFPKRKLMSPLSKIQTSLEILNYSKWNDQNNIKIAHFASDLEQRNPTLFRMVVEAQTPCIYPTEALSPANILVTGSMETLKELKHPSVDN